MFLNFSLALWLIVLCSKHRVIGRWVNNSYLALVERIGSEKMRDLFHFVSHPHNHPLSIFSVASYNQPRLCQLATWNDSAITFADLSSIGNLTYNIFVDTSNTVYAAVTNSNLVMIWRRANISLARNITAGLSLPNALFVTNRGDIMVGNSAQDGRVDRWSVNSTTGVPVMYVSVQCFGLFVDQYDNLYCSLRDFHQVVSTSLTLNMSNSSTVVVGTGRSGSADDELTHPHGIFMNSNFTLYVADYGNNRIQRFELGQVNGKAVAGNGSSPPFSLKQPTGVVVDGNGFLFIVDHGNNRIIGSSSRGLRCVAGCSSSSGSAAHQLSGPHSISFDIRGNIYVADTGNNRIQTFMLTNNFCSEWGRRALS